MQIIDARCSACGHNTNLRIGGSMAGYMEFLWWPVSCPQCRAVTDANVRARPLSCDVCKSSDVIEMHNARLCAGDGKYETIMCFERRLTDSRYKCPACDAFELRFGKTSRFID